MVIAVDPGVKCAGVAVFEDSELTAAWLARGEDWKETAWAIWNELERRYPLEILCNIELAIEVMQVYQQRLLKGDPNDLIDVSLMAGVLIGIATRAKPGTPIVVYRPKQWKGQVPKEVMTRRIKEKLSQEERERVELPKAKSLWHNIYDAIGIGLHHNRKGRRQREGAKRDHHQVGD